MACATGDLESVDKTARQKNIKGIRFFHTFVKIKKLNKMIKQLLFGAAFMATALINAQTGKIANPGTLAPVNVNNVSVTQGALPTTCYTISTISGTAISVGTASSDTTVPGCAPVAGYVFGSNCYDDLEKANYIAGTNYSAVTSPSVTEVKVIFYKNLTRGTTGTASVAVNLALYTGSLASGPSPTIAIATSTANLGLILAAQGGTANTFFAYTYTFTPAIAVPANGFFASVSLPIGVGDTAVVANDPVAPSNITWEKFSDGTWTAMNLSWGAGFKGNMAVMPTVCGQSITVGVSANAGLSKSISLMPNPTSGIVNISVNPQLNENLSITVTNALGQVVKTASYNAISNDNLSLDLTSQVNGVYFVTISNGSDKMVQRLILNK
jgi:hypothetical protein